MSLDDHFDALVREAALVGRLSAEAAEAFLETNPRRRKTMNDQERDARLLKLLDEEAEQPEGWWWLSFAEESGSLGCVIVRGRGVLTAVLESKRLEANPGGEVLAVRIEPGKEPSAFLERLLSPDEAKQLANVIDGAA